MSYVNTNLNDLSRRDSFLARDRPGLFRQEYDAPNIQREIMSNHGNSPEGLYLIKVEYEVQFADVLKRTV